MKIAVSGKGGVGKTTLAAALAHLYAADGHTVLAVDADPDANLGMALGVPAERLRDLKSISKMEEIIAERTGARPGSMGGWFSLNPRVDDIPERCWLALGNIRLIVMGGVDAANAGCACPESTFLKALMRNLVMAREEVAILDMEAGLEHLGRGTARGMDAMIVVVEPGKRSIHTAHVIARMAKDLGINHVFAVANKVRPEDIPLIQNELGELPLIGTIPVDDRLKDADMTGRPPWEMSPELLVHVSAIRDRLSSVLQGG